VTTAETVAFSAMAVREAQRAKEMRGWKCLDRLGSENADHNKNPLTDLTVAGDDSNSGTDAPLGQQVHRPAPSHRYEPSAMARKPAHGLHNIGDVEIPACMAK